MKIQRQGRHAKVHARRKSSLRDE